MDVAHVEVPAEQQRAHADDVVDPLQERDRTGRRLREESPVGRECGHRARDAENPVEHQRSRHCRPPFRTVRAACAHTLRGSAAAALGIAQRSSRILSGGRAMTARSPTTKIGRSNRMGWCADGLQERVALLIRQRQLGVDRLPGPHHQARVVDAEQLHEVLELGDGREVRRDSASCRPARCAPGGSTVRCGTSSTPD